MSLKDIKMKYIVDVAADMFSKRGVRDVTIHDIAKEAGIGEATVYRYFLKKQNIVLASALYLKEKVFTGYFDLSKGKTGFEKLEIFYNSYLSIFNDKPKYFYFINEFDAYMCMEEGVSLDQYEKEVDTFKVEFEEAYQLGLKDGSVKKVDDIETFYFSSTHALLELCKKLSVDQAILKQDKNAKKSAEIHYLIKMILDSLRAC